MVGIRAFRLSGIAAGIRLKQRVMYVRTLNAFVETVLQFIEVANSTSDILHYRFKLL